jgi:hypothetical protein
MVWLWYNVTFFPKYILYAYLATGEMIYKEIARLLLIFIETITENSIKVISDKGWLHNSKTVIKNYWWRTTYWRYYTILALMGTRCKNTNYLHKMETAFGFEQQPSQKLALLCTEWLLPWRPRRRLHQSQSRSRVYGAWELSLATNNQKCRQEVEYNKAKQFFY